MALEVGIILEGKVTGITKFGAFVALPEGQTGLIHISEVANDYVKEVSDFLKDGDIVKVKVINLDPNGKIGLSIKKANADYQPRPPKPQRPQRTPQKVAPPAMDFESLLSRFIKDSDERQLDLKRNIDSRRGGRGGSR
ncbi:MAG: S1 RNA-binding domain-containing protein [Clostridia bacterium]